VSISIIDTKKLPSENIFMYTPDLHKAVLSHQQYLPLFDNEFLCFGPISGKAHCAVRFDQLKQAGLTKLLYLYTSSRHAIVTAMIIGACFGEQFFIPVTVYLLAIGSPKLDLELIAILKRAMPPPEWLKDPTIMHDGFACGDRYKEVAQAISILRRWTQAKHPGFPSLPVPVSKKRKQLHDDMTSKINSSTMETPPIMLHAGRDERLADSMSRGMPADIMGKLHKELFVQMKDWPSVNAIAKHGAKAFPPGKIFG
jgi:hypothetical protein